MRVVFFDLGKTLEDGDVLLPGARETVTAIQQLRDAEGGPVMTGLISDFDTPTPADPLPAIRERYVAILVTPGIRALFEPIARRATLSFEVGVFKPDPKIFRAALDKMEPDLPFAAAFFVTENLAHVQAARQLGMRAVHFRGPGQ